MQLAIDHREEPEGTVVVTIAGKLMLGTDSQRLETLVTELLAKGRRRFVFDLSGVTRLDSTGIGRFISCYSQITAAGGGLALAGATGYIREGFKISRLDTVFRFCPDVASAARSLGPAG